MRSDSPPDSPPLVGIALLSFCVLALEICLTRLFGWLLRYHFAFFAISLAMCGLGLGGYVAHLVLRRRHESADRLLVVAGYGVTLTTLASLVLVMRLVVPSRPTEYALVGALLMLPFLSSGAVLAVLFDRHAGASGKLYAADLLGAAAAAPGAVVLLNALGPIDSMLLVAALAACVPLSMVKRRRGHAVAAVFLSVACVAALLVDRGRPFLDLPLTKAGLRRVIAELAEEGRGPDHPAADVLKRLVIHLADPQETSRILYTDWNAFGRTDVEEQEGMPYMLQLWLDGDVPAPMMRFDGDYEKLAFLRRHPASLPYHLRPLRTVLSLGSGGGLDVLVAKLHGADSIDAVEINPAIPRILRRPEYRQFSGAVYDQPGVRFHLTEGRSFVKQSTARYDLIVLSLTQAFTTGNAGMALMESYIHTLEACREYYRRLSDDGMVMLLSGDAAGMLPMRWFFTCLEAVTLETKKTEADALEHLMLAESPPGHSPYDYVVLMSRRPMAEEDVQRALSLPQEMGRFDFTFIPRRESRLGEAIRRQGWRAFATAVKTALPKASPGLRALNLAPATDDSPFFLDLTFGAPAPLRHLFYFALGLTVLFLATAVFFTMRPVGREGPAAGLVLFTVYFSCLGVGFILIEVGLIQRLMILLGSPTHTVALILFAMLLGGALGSERSQRLPADTIGRAGIAGCLAIALAASLLCLFLPWVIDALLRASYLIRLATGFVLCALLGVLMGVPFPAGVRLAARWRGDAVPYVWGVNGVTSVLGSVLAAICGKPLGFTKVILIGGVFYFLAAGCLAGLRKGVSAVRPGVGRADAS